MENNSGYIKTYQHFTNMTKRLAFIACFCAFLLAILGIFYLGGYLVHQVTILLVFIGTLSGYNLLIGYNGQFSFGHAAFFAVGAYVSAIMIDQYSIPYYLTILPAGLVCFVLGYLFGFPALRLEGLYLALTTFALVLVVPQLLKYFGGITGGVQGIFINKPPAPTSLGLNDDQWIAYFVIFVVTLLLIGAWNLTRGRIGRAMKAIRDNPIAAETMGINLSYVKTMTFGYSTFYAGITGALYLITLQYISPDMFSMYFAIPLIIAIIIGGIGTFTACIVGGAFIVYAPNLAEYVLKDNPDVMFGILLLIVIYTFPMGVGGLVALLRFKLLQRYMR